MPGNVTTGTRLSGTAQPRERERVGTKFQVTIEKNIGEIEEGEEEGKTTTATATTKRGKKGGTARADAVCK